MLKSIVYAIIFSLVASLCKGISASERFVISSAYCIGNSWDLIILDNATGDKLKITPNKRNAKKYGVIFESFNPNEPSIVIRIGNMRYLVRMKKQCMSTCNIESENSAEIISNLNKEISFENSAISRSEILSNIKNLN